MNQANNSATSHQPIENYASIGDLHTVALVSMNGSTDWCGIPCFDSPGVFETLLDARKWGFFRITPPDSPGMGHR